MKKGPTKLETKKLIAELEKASRKRKQRIWLDIAKRLKKPRRQRAFVNVWKLNELGKKHKNKVLLVPGKVLGYGQISQKVSVAALEFSDSAKKAISEKGTALLLQEVLEKKLKPKDIIIVK